MVRLHMGGQAFKLANLPSGVQDAIKKRLAQKDPVMAQAMKGVLPGIKINGKPVTQESIKEIEIKSMGDKPKKVEKLSKVKDEKVLTKVVSQLKTKIKAKAKAKTKTKVKK